MIKAILSWILFGRSTKSNPKGNNYRVGQNKPLYKAQNQLIKAI